MARPRLEYLCPHDEFARLKRGDFVETEIGRVDRFEAGDRFMASELDRNNVGTTGTFVVGEIVGIRIGAQGDRWAELCVREDMIDPVYQRKPLAVARLLAAWLHLWGRKRRHEPLPPEPVQPKAGKPRIAGRSDRTYPGNPGT